uniref:Uncharacterized protein n=1 Tax=Oryzias latipes TaxID=8090 RepID=A0A3P9KGV6_ORYLA
MKVLNYFFFLLDNNPKRISKSDKAFQGKKTKNSLKWPCKSIVSNPIKYPWDLKKAVASSTTSIEQRFKHEG